MARATPFDLVAKPKVKPKRKARSWSGVTRQAAAKPKLTKPAREYQSAQRSFRSANKSANKYADRGTLVPKLERRRKATLIELKQAAARNNTDFLRRLSAPKYEASRYFETYPKIRKKGKKSLEYREPAGGYKSPIRPIPRGGNSLQIKNRYV